jgi:hypothetical protein
MPKNPVTDHITDQEIAFVHLILSGTMTDREAAEAVRLNSTTAAYAKAKPRVQAYMAEHRARVQEKLIDLEADGLRSLNLGRDQILARLWYLASLSPEETRGSISGQIKAMSMVVAIEGLIPNRRLFPAKPQICFSEPDTQTQRQAESTEPGEAVSAVEVQPAAPQVSQPETSPIQYVAPPPKPVRNYTTLENPFVYPEATNPVLAATDRAYDVHINPPGSLRLPILSRKGAFAKSC